MKKTKATKNDKGKVDLSLLSPIMKEGVARAMQFGAEKYSRHNYLNGGFTSGRLLASLMRHIDAYVRGEDLDPESGLHHLFHAGANIQMLVDNMHEGTLEDNRYHYKK